MSVTNAKLADTGLLAVISPPIGCYRAGNARVALCEICAAAHCAARVAGAAGQLVPRLHPLQVFKGKLDCAYVSAINTKKQSKTLGWHPQALQGTCLIARTAASGTTLQLKQFAALPVVGCTILLL